MMTRRSSKHSNSGSNSKKHVSSQFIDEFKEFKIIMQQEREEKERRKIEKERQAEEKEKRKRERERREEEKERREEEKER